MIAVVDLQTREGADLVGATWRYADARVREIAFVGVGADLAPGDTPNRTYDIEPHAQAPDYDDGDWRVLAPEETRLRLGNGRVSFNWYRLNVTIPERIGDFDPTGSTAVFEIVIDDYAEVWVDGELPLALGLRGGQVVGGFNAPNRVVLGRDVRPGDTFSIAVFGINGPISASPHNYIWVRSATLDFHTADGSERVATGFEFTEGPVWTPDGALLFSSPNTNEVYRWSPGTGRADVFMTKSGYSGPNIHRLKQPGSNGLAFDPEGRLVMCQHGNRRVLRVNPHGDTTVLADRYGGRRLNSPNDLVFRSDGTLYFTDPPFGLPEGTESELGFSGVYLVRPDGEIVLLDDTLSGPNGIAFSPDERTLYVGNWDLEDKTVYRYDVLDDGTVGPPEVLFDMTAAPGEDAIDGLKVDVEGTVYACGPGGIWVISPSGDHLRTIEVPEAPHNLAWGDDDARTLYITAETSVYRLRMDVEGVRR